MLFEGCGNSDFELWKVRLSFNETRTLGKGIKNLSARRRRRRLLPQGRKNLRIKRAVKAALNVGK